MPDEEPTDGEAAAAPASPEEASEWNARALLLRRALEAIIHAQPARLMFGSRPQVCELLAAMESAADAHEHFVATWSDSTTLSAFTREMLEDDVCTPAGRGPPSSRFLSRTDAARPYFADRDSLGSTGPMNSESSPLSA
ncbi:hypothetical protein FHX42_001489 [Saccharopolyspora lacisalsi]|uniref:Uncharacterized protein n=1 Tax=Halosaccharopolyspora lacisalsi TaxID=1000566 RepID=A0A839DT92_9PSEU|nr:hypothetical protein [Halosaccharopolyspora lacisalsi]MBA8824160.1 hypothetical protein [Halosaccharopolyspora lacisalsi]